MQGLQMQKYSKTKIPRYYIYINMAASLVPLKLKMA